MKQVVLNSYVQGEPRPENFRIEEAPVPVPADGEVLVRNLWLSLDPLIRFALDEVRLTGATHVGVGEVVYGATVSQIIESRHPDYRPGEFVEGRTGWREYAALDPVGSDRIRGPMRRLDPEAFPLAGALGAMGMPGQTAHACIVGIGRVQAGETVVISAAGGAVGSLAGQIAKIIGAKVVGIAGGEAKCSAVRALGFDDCIDYKAPDFTERLRAAVPGGVDVYVDNVGGDVMLAVLPSLKYRARMPVCGFISYYGMGMEGPGPDKLPGFMRAIMSKGLEIRGFGGAMVGGEAALADMAQWLREGRLKATETVVEGLENAAAAFCDSFRPGNGHLGKVLVRIAS